jgi:hypothetical protein
MIAFHAGRLAACTRLSDRHLDAALREIDGQGQTDWSTADDQHLRVDSIAHGSLAVFGDYSSS